MADPTQNNQDWRSLYPFASRWVGVPGGRMHYIDEGPTNYSGQSRGTLLFVHGNPTWSFHWRRLVAALRRHYRCVAIDHLGCGLSDKPARFLTLDDHIQNLAAFIDQLGLDRLTLVAQDWGGAIGLGTMLRMPERLERIVLFNTGAFPPTYIPWRIRACRVPILGQLAVQGANLFSLAALRMTLARRDKLEPAVAAGYLAPYNSWSNRRAVYGFVRDIPSPLLSEILFDPLTLPYDDPVLHPTTWGKLHAIENLLPRSKDCPSCLIWGMKDWCFRPDCLDRFLAAWPNAEVHRLTDVGHWVVEDAPDDALAIMESFLSATAPSIPHPASSPTA